MEHFEYYWGLRKGELDLATSLNYIERELHVSGCTREALLTLSSTVRSDMAELFREGAWTLVPTKQVLNKISTLGDANSNVRNARLRKRYTQVLAYCSWHMRWDLILFAATSREGLRVRVCTVDPEGP